MIPEERIIIEGKHLAIRPFCDYVVSLYLFEDEFYEVWYYGPSDEIERIEKLDNEKKLDLYINFMQL